MFTDKNPIAVQNKNWVLYFNKQWKRLMNAIKNMVVYQDDICLGDITEKELNPKTVFMRQRRASMLMNWKNMFIIGNIVSWRYLILKASISPNLHLIQKILNESENRKIKKKLFCFHRRYLQRNAGLIYLLICLNNSEFI